MENPFYHGTAPGMVVKLTQSVGVEGVGSPVSEDSLAALRLVSVSEVSDVSVSDSEISEPGGDARVRVNCTQGAPPAITIELCGGGRGGGLKRRMSLLQYPHRPKLSQHGHGCDVIRMSDTSDASDVRSGWHRLTSELVQSLALASSSSEDSLAALRLVSVSEVSDVSVSDSEISEPGGDARVRVNCTQGAPPAITIELCGGGRGGGLKRRMSLLQYPHRPKLSQHGHGCDVIRMSDTSDASDVRSGWHRLTSELVQSLALASSSS